MMQFVAKIFVALVIQIAVSSEYFWDWSNFHFRKILEKNLICVSRVWAITNEYINQCHVWWNGLNAD